MKTVNKLIPQGQGLSAVLIKRGTHVELDWDTRQKSRFEALDSAGDALGVFLPRGAVVRGGDVLVAEDGALVRVVARSQPVLTVRAAQSHQGSPLALLRAAYHLGNRHVALEVHADRLQLEPDHVLADMLRQMHLEVVEQLAPFEPEGGAYTSAADAHGHAHAHVHADAHAHTPDPALMRSPAPQAPHGGDPRGHVHGPNCKHDH